MTDFTATNNSPEMNYLEKVQKSVVFNNPAEQAYRAWEENSAAKKAGEIEYEQREIIDGDANYVVEDREDGSYVVARQAGEEPIRNYGEEGLKIDQVPEEAIEKDEYDRLSGIMKATGETGEGLMRGLGLGTTKLVANVIRSAVDNPIGDYVVGEENIQKFEEFTKEFLKNAEKAAGHSAFGEQEEFGKAGQIAKGVGDVTGQYVAPAGGLYKLYRAMGAGALLSSFLADGTVGFFGVSPEQENLANMIPEDSKAFGALRELIATDPEDPDLENRTKNALEAVTVLGLSEAATRGIIGAVKSGKKAVMELEVPEKIGKMIDKYITDETGAIDLGKLTKPADVEKAGALIAKKGDIIVEPDVVNRARAALKATGNAEGIDFNLSKMETSDQLDNLIDTLSEVYKEPIKKAKRGVETFTETQAKSDLARLTGFDIDKVLSRRPGELWPAHKIKAARDIFVSELQKTETLARSIKSGENTSENLIAFRRQLAVVSGLQSQIKGVQTETARALSQYRMTAKTPMEAQVNISEMIQKSGGADTNETLVDAYLNVLENGGDDAAATFARNAEQVTGWDMLYEAWINSLLGSPATHAVNGLGNTLTVNQAVVERYAAATYGAIERGVKGVFGKEGGGITFKEANAFAQGQVMSVNDGMIAFAKALREGEGSDLFGKIDYHGSAITSQNMNELPLSKTIASKMLQGDELIKSNSQLAHMIDFMGEYYYRLPGRFLMAEDEFFKTINYRAELHALAAREASEAGLDKAGQLARVNEILADPQMNAPELHRQAFEFAREQTFTTPAGEVAQRLSGFLNNAKVGNFPAGRVVVPFFNVINNITKYVGGRVPGLGLINPNSKTYKDFFSKDPAKRQLVMGKWASGSSLLGFGAWSSMNGVCTGRISDNFKMVQQIEQGQGKKRYACHLPGTDKMMNYNRLEPAGMLMAIAADTATALAYVDDDEERQNLVLAATAAVVPYMEDKSFFEGISRFFEAFNPQFADDEERSKALGRYFSDLLSTAPGAIGGPLAPGTPLSRNMKTNLFMDRAKRISEANKWTIEKDEYGDDIMIANSEDYRMWDRAIKKIYGATPGLSKNLPADVNIWGEEIHYEGGLGPDIVTPIYTNTPKFDIKDLQGKNFPAQIEAGRFRDMRVGTDMTVKQHRKFVDVVGIDGELERLNMPLSKPSKRISVSSLKEGEGLPVELNHDDYIDLIKLMNTVTEINEFHPDRKRMNLKETLDYMIKQEIYAILPDDLDASGTFFSEKYGEIEFGGKAEMIKYIVRQYKKKATAAFFEYHPKGQAYFRKSVEMKQKAQNTGVQ